VQEMKLISERWCITTASDALLREFADRQTVFSLDLDWSEKTLFHAWPRCAVAYCEQRHLKAQHKRLLIGPSIQPQRSRVAAFRVARSAVARRWGQSA
jgi:hypothetical protein